MTDKELHKLRKTELLEVLLALRNELERVKQENVCLQKKLEAAETQKTVTEDILHTVRETAMLVQQLCPKESINDMEHKVNDAGK